MKTVVKTLRGFDDPTKALYTLIKEQMKLGLEFKSSVVNPANGNIIVTFQKNPNNRRYYYQVISISQSEVSDEKLMEINDRYDRDGFNQKSMFFYGDRLIMTFYKRYDKVQRAKLR